MFIIHCRIYFFLALSLLCIFFRLQPQYLRRGKFKRDPLPSHAASRSLVHVYAVYVYDPAALHASDTFPPSREAFLAGAAAAQPNRSVAKSTHTTPRLTSCCCRRERVKVTGCIAGRLGPSRGIYMISCSAGKTVRGRAFCSIYYTCSSVDLLISILCNSSGKSSVREMK